MKFPKKSKPFLYLLLIPIIYFCVIFYDETLSESALLSKKFNDKISLFLNSESINFSLKDLVSFNWDVVCFYNEEGQNIDLEDKNLIKNIGYKPEFIFRSKYYINYDNSALLFSDSKTKKIIILRHIKAWHHLKNITPYYDGCYRIKDNPSFFINKKR
jgi:hypothetical protein